MGKDAFHQTSLLRPPAGVALNTYKDETLTTQVEYILRKMYSQHDLQFELTCQKYYLLKKKVERRKTILLNIRRQLQNNHRGSVPFPMKQEFLTCRRNAVYSCYSNGMLGILVKLMVWEWPCFLIDSLQGFTCKNTVWTLTRISYQQQLTEMN